MHQSYMCLLTLLKPYELFQTYFFLRNTVKLLMLIKYYKQNVQIYRIFF